MRLVSPNFITEVIDRDLKSGRHSEVVTRFPPEPNGYLHIGHAKAIFADFGIAQDYGGKTYLRMDDTNPTTEDMEYVKAILEDVRWLGFEPEELTFASDQFEEMYRWAIHLIEQGHAYVDSLSEEEIREYRGTVNEPGTPSPYRDRSVEENLDLFRRMRAGEFKAGEHVLRARIDMANDNMLMRDPILYRIRHAEHFRTGDDWPIYPLYDYAHPLTDALEGVTHSMCSLEFDNNRAVYDWVVEHTVDGPQRPHQYEFSRLQLDYTVLSKRKLIQLVQHGLVNGWDDPRMPTIAGLRRRGVTPAAIRDFANRVGVTKVNSRTDPALLEYSIREDLNTRASRVLAVTEPLKVTISNFSGDPAELTAPFWPEDVPNTGSRQLSFGPELFIERGDFAEEPPPGWKRLTPGRAVRLRHGPVIRCDEVEHDADGNVTGLVCSYWPDSVGTTPEGVKVQGTIHWLEASSAVPAEFRLYDRLFTVADPDTGEDWLDHFNPESLTVRHGFVEAGLAHSDPAERHQFERLGYFWQDPVDSRKDALVYNRIVTLKDSWARQESGAAREQAESRARKERLKAQQAEPEPEREYDEASLALSSEYGIDSDSAAVLTGRADLETYFREAALHLPDQAELLANWVVNEIVREARDVPAVDLLLQPRGLAELVGLVADGTVTARTAKEVFAEAMSSGASPASIVAERDLGQVNDETELTGLVERILADHPEQVAAWRGGKTGLTGFFVGQLMKQTGGRANPQLARELVERALSAD